ncbi:MAG TPA: hypothetical protein VEB21_20850, partial [Terriglobales bacterium]|nr:hypothetical protein [Terriglobales bacterium]
RNPESVEAFFAEVAAAKDPRVDRYAEAIREDLIDFSDIEARARQLVERMAMALQASLLVRVSDAAVADAFCASRLAREKGAAFGTLSPKTDFRRIIERARPQVG